MPRRICRDMRLIDFAYGKSSEYFFVGGFHRGAIGGVKWAFMLVYHYAVLFQGAKAATVKFLCENTLAGAERIGRIDNYNVVLPLAFAHVFYAVLKK